MLVVSAVLLLLATPSVVHAAYTSTVAGAVATMTGDAASDTLTITQAGGLFQHNRAGDPGFNSAFDFNTAVAGDQTVSATTGVININAGDGNDIIALGDGINIRGAIDGGPGIDTIDYSASTTAIVANLGLGTTGLSATLGADQENPPTGSAATGTATVSNYNIVTHTFDITVTVVGITPAEVTGFHIHQGVPGVNGPIIVDFVPLGGLTPVGTGFTFTMAGLTLPAASEAAFLGGGTYVNVHTAVFPGGAIRGQIYSGGNVNLAVGAATGTVSVANVENVTGGTGNDSLVGSSAINTIIGGAGADWIVGGPGNDILTGGAGADVLVWSNGDGTDVDEGGTEADIVQVNGSTTAADIFTVTPNGTRLRFDRTNLGLFSLDIGTVETLIVNGVGGNDSFTVADLTGVATLTTLNLNGEDGDDTFIPASATAFVFSAKGGPGTDTIDYSAYTTAVTANLGLGTTGLAATLGADQENPPTTHTATATAAVTNYNIVTHTFDVSVTVTGITPAEVTGFHIHQGAVGVNGPIIVDFNGLAPLVAAGTGFTFNATGVTLPAASEAAFLGGGTYVNVHTAVFPGGAIRGQLFSGGNVQLGLGAGTGTLGPAGAGGLANIENVTGGSGNDSLVGSFGINTLNGGAGNDWIVGGPGNDVLNGGEGADVLVWSNGDGTDVDEGGTEADTVQVNGSTAAGDIFVVSANGTRLRFDRTNLGLFSLDIGTVETLIVNGIGGDDSFTVTDLTGVASLATQKWNGFDGADTFNVRAFASGTPSVTGGPGADTLNYNQELRAVSGDTTPPDGSIDSPGVQSVTFVQVETVVIPGYSSTLAGITATMTGVASADTLTITQSGGLFHHNRFAAGDPGFASDIDFDSTVPGDQTLSSATGVININAGGGNNTIAMGDGVNLRGTIDGGGGTDTLDYTASTTAVSANLGLGTTGLSATLGADQENPPTTHAATGTAAVTNYNIVTHTFDIAVTVTGITPAEVTGFHIHQGAVGVNGPIIVDFTGVAPLIPVGTGFTFTVTGLVLPAVNEAAFLGGGTYVNVHTSVFPGGAIRGQLFSGGNVNLASGAATGTTSITNIENVTGGTGNDSLVGSFAINTINGGAGADWIVAGPGNDVLNGGAGADVLVWSNGDGTDVDEGGTEADTVQVNGNTANPDIFTVAANGTRVRFDRLVTGPFSLDIGTVETLIVNGIGGDDSFTVNSLTGVASLTSVRLNGFDGLDTFNVKASVPAGIAVRGGAGADTLNYDAELRFITGDTTPPDGVINSPGVQAVTFTQTEAVNITNPHPPVPIGADFDGDRKGDVVVFRNSSGTWFRLSSSSGFTVGSSTAFGQSGDLIVPGDYDRDGKIDLAVFRPGNATWYILQSLTGTVVSYVFGAGTDIPVPGDYDGDQKTDPAVYRPSTGVWSVLTSGSNYTTTLTFTLGVATDIPVPADYDGDGITDGAVYHPSTGVWTTRTAVSGFATGISFQWGLPGDLPVPGDYDGDAIEDIAVYRPSSGVWFLRQSSTANTTFVSFQFGLNGDVPVPGDYDGDGKTDLAVFRPSNGTWYIALSTTGYTTSVSYQFGLTGDVPAPNVTITNATTISRRTVANLARTADLDGDGRADINVYRPSTGTWFNLKSSLNYSGFGQFQWGLSGDIPVSSDYDGDGVTDLAVWRPSNGTWFIRQSITGFVSASSFQWGLPGDIPVPSDFDGDSKADLVVWRPSTGTWFIRQSSTGYTTFASFQWGLPGDVPVGGDYDGDNVTDLAVWRPSTGTWFIRLSSTGYTAQASFQWGLAGDIAVPGDYDGDGKTDLAVYRPSSGTWFIRLSSTGYATSAAYQWGLSGDVPVPGDFDGDGKIDMAVFRPSSSEWFLLQSNTNFTVAVSRQWGLTGDIPILLRQ
jgi:hypothetical protein